MTERTLGMTWFSGNGSETVVRPKSRHVNTRNSLWPIRWPAVAKESCIDIIEAAPPEEQSMVKFDLPCHACELSSSCLNAKGKETGTLLFDREFLTSPRTGASSLFPRELMEPMLNTGRSFQQSVFRNREYDQHLAVAQAWDLAWSERTGGDYLVCMTAVVDLQRGIRQLVQLERWQRLTFDEQCKLIQAKWAQYQSDLVIIESDAAQSIWAQHIAATSPVPVVRHEARGKKDLATGVPSMLIQFQNRKWDFPYQPGSYLQEEMENLLAELEAFGWVDGKLEGVGEHDDTVMALWHLSWGIDTLLLRAAATDQYLGVQPGRYS